MSLSLNTSIRNSMSMNTHKGPNVTGTGIGIGIRCSKYSVPYCSIVWDVIP